MKSKKMSALGIIGGLLLFALIIYWGVISIQKNKSTPAEPLAQPAADEIKMDSVMTADDQKMYDYRGALEDVTEGSVRGINTEGLSSGIAQARFKNGVYELRADFSNLPDPVGDDFYEGWIVQKLPFKFISTGVVEKIDSMYTNIFALDEDVTSYARYVLTLEPNDGDPAPADHIVEGDMEKL